MSSSYAIPVNNCSDPLCNFADRADPLNAVNDILDGKFTTDDSDTYELCHPLDITVSTVTCMLD